MKQLLSYSMMSSPWSKQWLDRRLRLLGQICTKLSGQGLPPVSSLKYWLRYLSCCMKLSPISCQTLPSLASQDIFQWSPMCSGKRMRGTLLSRGDEVEEELVLSMLQLRFSLRGLLMMASEKDQREILSMSSTRLRMWQSPEGVLWMLKLPIISTKFCTCSSPYILFVAALRHPHHLSQLVAIYFYKLPLVSRHSLLSNKAIKIYYWALFLLLQEQKSMRHRPFVVPTSNGQLELTKGTFLTLKREKLRAANPPKKGRKIVKEGKQECLGLQMDSISKRTRAKNSIRNEYRRLRESQQEMEEETTWSNINLAVYSLSLSLSAANYDHHFPDFA